MFGYPPKLDASVKVLGVKYAVLSVNIYGVIMSFWTTRLDKTYYIP